MKDNYDADAWKHWGPEMKLTIDAIEEELHNMRRSGHTPSAIVCTHDQLTAFKASSDALKYLQLHEPPQPETILGYPVNIVPATSQRFVLNEKDALGVKHRI